MKLPKLKKGDILVYRGLNEHSIEGEKTLLLLSNPMEVSVRLGSGRMYKLHFLHDEQVKEKEIEICIVLAACDIFRSGKLLWRHIDIKEEKQKFDSLREATNYKG